jgi:leucyl-tRNA synthetase
MSEHTNGPGPEPDTRTGDGASAGASAATGPSAGSSASTGDAGALPPFRYDARLANEIEHRWQAQWAAEGTFETPNPAGSLAKGFGAVADRPKLFVMDMFPYPSGTGLHVGHPLGYISTDVYARFQRMTGHNVLHPFGYDAFGLPAEQYAIDTGQHPAVTTKANIANMRRQLRRLGFGHDRRREFATSDPSYYRWTQWIFLKIFNSWFDDVAGRARPIDELVAEFESGGREPASDANPGGRPWARLGELDRRKVVDSYRLAYISEELVNWCPGLGTVLANEEITAEGRSDIGNYPVYRRPLRQWMLRITAYAQRLVDDLDGLDWPDSIKQIQRNWIGPSDGTNVEFQVHGAPDRTVRVFTTRPDTLPGATYMVLAPEHPMVDVLVARDWPAGTPPEWRYPAGRALPAQGDAGSPWGHPRASDGPEPPDAPGRRHPENQPGGDGQAGGWTPAAAVRAYRQMTSKLGERDRAYGSHVKTGVFTGSCVVNPMTAEPIPVFVADYVLMGYGTGAIMAVPAHDERDLQFARQYHLPVRAVVRPPAEWFTSHGIPADTTPAEWPAAYAGDHGYLGSAVPGLELAGLGKDAAIQAAIGWLERRGAGRPARTYRLRDWLFSRQRYWGEPFPIVYDEHGLPLALGEEMLPVRLPEMTDFRPQPQEDEDSDPVPVLARATGWAEPELDLGDGPKRYRRETNTMPQWAGSCWYYLRYLDPDNDERLVDPDVERYWMVPAGAAPGDGGVDLYIGGAEHAVLHLLYARFWHKVLFDLGYVSAREPFWRYFNQGYILADAFTDSRGMYVPAAEVAEDAAGAPRYRGGRVDRRAGKMGKSKKNSVSPDDIYAMYGADTLRLYEMAMGPLDTDRPWRTDDMVGVHRFLQRVWRAVVDEQTGQPLVGDRPLDGETARRLHRTIMTVRRDFAELRFNTAIARLIELSTHAARVAARERAMPRALAEPLLLMIAPLAPHIAEELWRRMGTSAR